MKHVIMNVAQPVRHAIILISAMESESVTILDAVWTRDVLIVTVLATSVYTKQIQMFGGYVMRIQSVEVMHVVSFKHLLLSPLLSQLLSRSLAAMTMIVIF